MIGRGRQGIDWHDDRGQVAGVEAIPFGVLIFVVGALLVTNAWAVVDAKLAMADASREAVRAYVEAPGAAAAGAAAQRAADEAVAGHGRNPGALRLLVHHEGEAPFRRCVRVTVTARYAVPALSLPWIGGYGHAFDVAASHSEIIDPYRAGLPAEGGC